MKPTDNQPDAITEFRRALHNSDVDGLRRICANDPEIFRKLREAKERVVCEGARRSSPEAMRILIELGADVNEQDSNHFTGLSWAVTKGRYDVAKTLLECGADPNLDCPLFAVANSKDLQDRVSFAKLLLDHGANLNAPFLVEGLPARNALSEAIAKGRTELVAFLQGCGAQLPTGAESSLGTPADHPPTAGYAAEILDHFTKHYGTVEQRVIREIVPTSQFPIVVHCIRPSLTRDYAVLFTEGLSRFEMPVPREGTRYRRAELMLTLPHTWPAPEEALKDPRFAWPVQWLRKIAAYPVANNTWLGGPWTVISNEEPPQPLGPGTRFTAWILFTSQSPARVIPCRFGTKIQIFHMFPIYTEEYEFERKHGTDALLRLLKSSGMASYVDVNRRSAVKAN